MVLDDKTRELLKDKIETGEKELERLETALENIISRFECAFNEYGSELAGDDGGGGLREKIIILKARLEPLRKALGGELDISKDACDKRADRISQINRVIQFLQSEKEELDNMSHQAFIVRSILEGKLSFLD